MNYPLAEAILGFVGGSALDERLLRSHNEYAKTQRLDGPGFAGRLGEVLGAYHPATRFAQLNLLDSHDTPRLASLLRDDPRAVDLSVLLQATLPGAPCIYYGDEIGLEGGLDPDNRRAFPWDRGAWDEERLGFTTAALRLRAAEPLLRHGELEVAGAADGWMAFDRFDPGDPGARLRIVVNAGDAPTEVPLGDVAPGSAGADGAGNVEVLELPSLPRTQVVEGDGRDGARVARVPGRSGAVLRVRG
jgi:neopullulanase